jgi:hypothetical protein
VSLLGLRAGITAGIKTALPEVKSVETHGGAFDAGELKRIATISPAVRVAILGVGQARRGSGGTDLAVRCAAFVVTKTTPANPRDVKALALVSTLLHAVQGNAWGLAYADSPRDVAADNLFSGDLDKEGVALWAVHWDQEIRVGEVDTATLAAFKTFKADYDLAPKDGVILATDQVTGLDL